MHTHTQLHDSQWILGHLPSINKRKLKCAFPVFYDTRQSGATLSYTWTTVCAEQTPLIFGVMVFRATRYSSRILFFSFTITFYTMLSTETTPHSGISRPQRVPSSCLTKAGSYLLIIKTWDLYLGDSSMSKVRAAKAWGPEMGFPTTHGRTSCVWGKGGLQPQKFSGAKPGRYQLSAQPV